jgi:ribonuclease BN (tRNA processing enzyme)
MRGKMNEDRIIFLGTAGDEFTVGKQIRASGGIIIQTEGYQFMIDPGPGSLIQAKKANVNIRENTAVLVSHAHINHCNDVNVVLATMSRNKLDTKGVLIANTTFMNGDEKNKPYITDFHKNCVERIIIPKAGQKIGIEDIEIEVLKTKHSDTETIGFKFITPKFIAVYSSDTAYMTDLIEEYKDADILILNVVSPFEKKVDFNLNSDDAVNIIKRVKPRLTVITHFGKDMIEANPIYQARDISKVTETTVAAAEDGTSINPLNYASKTRQKRLESFETDVTEKTE